MLLDDLARPLSYATLHFCTASDLIRFQRCSHSCRQLLHDSAGIVQLLRQYFELSLQYISSLPPLTPATLQRLLAPLASLERQLDHRHPPRLHRALLTHALCNSSLSTTDLSLAHPPPPPPASLAYTTLCWDWLLPRLSRHRRRPA